MPIEIYRHFSFFLKKLLTNCPKYGIIIMSRGDEATNLSPARNWMK